MSKEFSKYFKEAQLSSFKPGTPDYNNAMNLAKRTYQPFKEESYSLYVDENGPIGCFAYKTSGRIFVIGGQLERIINNKDPGKFACYLLLDEQVIEKRFYQQKPEFMFNSCNSHNQKFSVKFFYKAYPDDSPLIVTTKVRELPI